MKSLINKIILCCRVIFKWSKPLGKFLFHCLFKTVEIVFCSLYIASPNASCMYSVLSPERLRTNEKVCLATYVVPFLSIFKFLSMHFIQSLIKLTKSCISSYCRNGEIPCSITGKVIIRRFIFITPTFNDVFHIIVYENCNWIWVATQCFFGFAALKNYVFIMNILYLRQAISFGFMPFPK